MPPSRSRIPKFFAYPFDQSLSNPWNWQPPSREYWMAPEGPDTPNVVWNQESGTITVNFDTSFTYDPEVSRQANEVFTRHFERRLMTQDRLAALQYELSRLVTEAYLRGYCEPKEYTTLMTRRAELKRQAETETDILDPPKPERTFSSSGLPAGLGRSVTQVAPASPPAIDSSRRRFIVKVDES